MGRTSSSENRMLMPSRVMSDDLVLAGSELHGDEDVARFDADGDDAVFADIGKVLERSLLDGALLGGEEEETGLLPGGILFVRPVAGRDADQSGDGFARLEFQEIGDAPAFGGAAHVRESRVRARHRPGRCW